MKNECCIIRDILPLYIENMVSDDTVCFIEEHLKNCSECTLEYEKSQEANVVSEKEDEKNTEQEIVRVIKKLRKKILKRVCIAVLAVCVGVVGVLATLQVFPVYRVFQRKWDTSFTNEQRWMLAYIGTPDDRKIATEILNYADIYVFSDTSHTYEENLELYGELGRYPFDSHHFDEKNERKALYETHSIELLSAHIDENHGYMFVEYSQQAISEDNEVVSGCWDIVSLWEIEKNSEGKWVVVDIIEHC